MFQYGIEAHNYVVRGRVTYNVVYYTEKQNISDHGPYQTKYFPILPDPRNCNNKFIKMSSASLQAWAIASVSISTGNNEQAIQGNIALNWPVMTDSHIINIDCHEASHVEASSWCQQKKFLLAVVLKRQPVVLKRQLHNCLRNNLAIKPRAYLWQGVMASFWFTSFKGHNILMSTLQVTDARASNDIHTNAHASLTYTNACTSLRYILQSRSLCSLV